MAETEKEYTSADINRKFTEIISSIGYTAAEQSKISKKFDICKKVQTIVTVQSHEEKKKNIAKYINELRKRQSLMNLIFLKHTLDIKASSHKNLEIFDTFVANSGFEMLENLVSSNNGEFLTILVDILAILKEKYNHNCRFLSEIVRKYAKIKKESFFRYLNVVDEISCLYVPVEESVHAKPSQSNFIPCYCNTYLKMIVDDVLGSECLTNELEFLIKHGCDVRKLINFGYLLHSEQKFKNAELYKRLTDLLQPKDTDQLRTEICKLNEKIKELTIDCSNKSVMKCAVTEDGRAVSADQRCDMRVDDKNSVITSADGKNTVITTVDSKNSASNGAQVSFVSPKAVVTVESKVEHSNTESSDVEPVRAENVVEPVKVRNAVEPVKMENAVETKAEIKIEKPKFGRFGRTKKVEIKPTVFDSHKYTGLSWTKTDKKQNTIFSRVEPVGVESRFNLSDFEELEVTCETKKTPETPREEAKAECQKIAECPECLDPKKSIALNIALGRIKIDDQQLVDEITNGRIENETLITQLITYFPSETEIAQIKRSKEPLGRAETFFRFVSDPSLLYNSLCKTRFALAFEARDYHSLLKYYDDFYRSILESRALVELFTVLLDIGNVLNTGTFNGKADGFSLDSLGVFSKDPRVLRIVSGKVDKRKLLDEIRPRDECKVAVDTLMQEVLDIKRKYKREYASDAVEKRYEDVIGMYEGVRELHQKLCVYFGSNDDKFVEKIFEFVNRLL